MHYGFQSTQTWTFKSRNQTVTKANQFSSVPGPSDYKVEKPLHKTGTIAQTKQSRNLWKDAQPNPGPGTYQPRSYITAGPKKSMSSKHIDYTKKTPGPQDYDNNTIKVKNTGAVHSLGNKSKSLKEIVTNMNDYKPSPSSYETVSSFQKKHGTFVGSSKRQDLTQTQKTPAPNYYKAENAADYASKTNPRCKVGTQFRTTDLNKVGEKTPGPAFYNKSTFVENNKDHHKGYSMRNKTNDLIAMEISKFPAPGRYQSHLKNKFSAPKCATNQAKRSTFMDDMQSFKKQFPGPGTHEQKFYGTKYRSASTNAFGKSPRKALDENQKTPGPMYYDNEKLKVLNKAPKFSSTGDMKNRKLNQQLYHNPENPGPGQYNPKQNLTKSVCLVSGVPKQQRPDFQKHKQTPGPGFYNLRGKQQGPRWGFKQEKRPAFTDHKNEGKDGQHYEIPSMIANPPKYMNVQSKVKFSPSKTGYNTTYATK